MYSLLRSSSVLAKKLLLLNEVKKFFPIMETNITPRGSAIVSTASANPFTMDVFKPPTSITPSNSIDRDVFSKTAIVPALKINKRRIHKVMKAFKCATFERARFAGVRDVPTDPAEKYLLLDPQKMSSLEAMTEKQRTVLMENEVEAELHEYGLKLTYGDWQAPEVLQRLLPSGVEVPTGFSRIGHIIHLNLRQAQLKHKHLIGEVLLEKNPGIRTVVNKLNEIDNTYRFFSMECVAGEPDTVVTVKEHHVSYSFDFAKVYWNPRLSTEHQRIVDKLKRTDVVYDMFAGVGPFAIPAAKKGCEVLANDLNPESYRWLQQNAKQNKVTKRVTASNLDGRQYIRDVVKPDLIRKAKEGFGSEAHVIMNLPAMAVEFLDVFPSLLSDAPSGLRDQIPKVYIHCHGFSKSETPAEDIRSRVEGILRCRLEAPEVHDVRDVAPNKEMMCISFPLPLTVLYEQPIDVNGDGNRTDKIEDSTTSAQGQEEPSVKKPRTS